MLKRKTVFVVGAGASCEAGLPSGQELRSKVADALNIRLRQRFEQASGSDRILGAFLDAARKEGRDVNEYFRAAWMIRDAMPLTLSIDNYIDAHRGNAVIELCGKLAISDVILQAEQESKLHIEPYSAERFLDLSKLDGTWYLKLFQLLSEGVSKADVQSFFGEAVFIVFNYDRCLEYFFREALMRYYGLAVGDAERLIDGASIIHPYGTVGKVDWQDRDGLSFGAKIGGAKLLEISAQLRTFTEQFSDDRLQHQIVRAIDEAETLVFLGFAFYDQNMKILEGTAELGDRKFFATAWGLSDSDCFVVSAGIRNLYDNSPQTAEVWLRNELKCAGLFDHFSRSLRSA